MPTVTQESIFEIVGKMYESAAAASSEGWADVYRQMSEHISSGPGSMHLVHKHDNRFEAIADTNHPEFLGDFNSTYFPILPFRNELLKLKSGDTFFRQRDCPDRKFVPSELYQDHFRKLGIYRILHQCLFDGDAVIGGVTFTRPEAMADFSGDDFRVVETLKPHLQRAMQLYFNVREANKKDRFLLETWNRLPQGVVVVSRTNNIAFTNKAADRYFVSGNGLALDIKGRLTADAPADTLKLRELIRGVFEPSAGRPSSFGGSMQIRRGSEMPPLFVLVTPFSEQIIGGAAPENAALLFITDPAEKSECLEASLRQVFGFTAAEAHLACSLADGLSLIECGEFLHVTQNTVRTHLKRIFDKTGTNRQGSLVKLILSLPSARRP